MKIYKTYLAGEWFESKDFIEVYSPIDLSLIGKVSKVPKEKAFETIEKLYFASKKIKALSINERLKILKNLANEIENNKNELKEILVLNNGKTNSQALSEIEASIQRLIYADYDCEKLTSKLLDGSLIKGLEKYKAIVYRHGYNVILSIIPFNYPLFDSIQKIVPSFLVGASILIKPPSSTCLPILHLAKIMENVFPKDSFAILTVPGKEMKEILQHELIDAILLTGSYETGLEISKYVGIKETFFELGGGDYAIVLKDANLKDAANKIVKGIISYSGQRCDAIKIIFAESEIYEELKNLLIQELEKSVVVGDPRNEKVTVGPLIDLAAAELFEKAINDAKEKNCKLLFGGERNKNYVKPALIEANKNVLPDLLIFKKEIFAPIAAIVKASAEEAIELANKRKYALDACIFGKDYNRIIKIANELEVNAIYVNDFPKHGIGFFPYGGRKISGKGNNGIGFLIERTSSYKSIIFSLE